MGESKGLVCSEQLEPGYPVAEVRGRFMIMDQFSGNKRRAQPHVLFYSPTGRPLAQQKGGRDGGAGSSDDDAHNNNDDDDDDDDDDDEETLCVDARRCGSEARAVRRSCRPTAELRHVLQNGLLQLWLVAGPRGLARDQEVTIAFELPPAPGVECACGRPTPACPYGSSVRASVATPSGKLHGRLAKQQQQHLQQQQPQHHATATATTPPSQRQFPQQHGNPQVGQHGQQHGGPAAQPAPTRPKKLAL